MTQVVDHSGTDNTKPLAIATSGWYDVNGQFEWTGGGYTDVRFLGLYMNPGADNSDPAFPPSIEATSPYLSHGYFASGPLYFRSFGSTQFLGLIVEQSSGAGKDTTGEVFLTVAFLGADLEPGRFPI